jgi:hypothetical protein
MLMESDVLQVSMNEEHEEIASWGTGIVTKIPTRKTITIELR